MAVKYFSIKCAGFYHSHFVILQDDIDIVVFYSSDDHVCREDWAKCDNGVQCYDLAWQCDGVVHCTDGSDERLCHHADTDLGLGKNSGLSLTRCKRSQSTHTVEPSSPAYIHL